MLQSFCRSPLLGPKTRPPFHPLPFMTLSFCQLPSRPHVPIHPCPLLTPVILTPPFLPRNPGWVSPFAGTTPSLSLPLHRTQSIHGVVYTSVQPKVACRVGKGCGVHQEYGPARGGGSGFAWLHHYRHSHATGASPQSGTRSHTRQP